MQKTIFCQMDLRTHRNFCHGRCDSVQNYCLHLRDTNGSTVDELDTRKVSYVEVGMEVK